MWAYEVQGFGWDALKRVERPRRALAEQEVRIRVRAAATNYRDLALLRGEYLPDMPRPYVPLSEGAGEVIEVGEGVDTLVPGQKVLGHYTSAWLEGPFQQMYHASKVGGPVDGWLAEEIILPASALLPMPEGWRFEEAAALAISGVTAWHALGDIKALAGRWVLIEGSGNVSLQALQQAAAAGAHPVVLTSRDDDERSRALREQGATAVIGPGSAADRREAILEASAGHGIDVALEVVGGRMLTELVLPVMATRGRVAIIGFLESDRVEGELVGPMLAKLLHLVGVSVGSRQHFEALLAFMVRYGLRPLIGGRYVPEAIREALSSSAPLGKSVILMP
ncbi:zinc-dependent alcohol dehydrogenase family protein [Halomonas faecis]|uniref:zinc-dependent alcohol dehydrogenase family protein n=1 Tax=Halomonas faecis TaxID=1562110 RepID=UPI0013D7B4C0|nr:NAD(P)-dependent alcohol dehydrogenase [Halomonas faecis]